MCAVFRPFGIEGRLGEAGDEVVSPVSGAVNARVPEVSVGIRKYFEVKQAVSLAGQGTPFGGKGRPGGTRLQFGNARTGLPNGRIFHRAAHLGHAEVGHAQAAVFVFRVFLLHGGSRDARPHGMTAGSGAEDAVVHVGAVKRFGAARPDEGAGTGVTGQPLSVQRGPVGVRTEAGEAGFGDGIARIEQQGTERPAFDGSLLADMNVQVRAAAAAGVAGVAQKIARFNRFAHLHQRCIQRAFLHVRIERDVFAVLDIEVVAGAAIGVSAPVGFLAGFGVVRHVVVEAFHHAVGHSVDRFAPYAVVFILSAVGIRF